MEEKIIQITSGKGPEECERVVAFVFDKIKKQALREGFEIVIIELIPGRYDTTYLSVVLKLSGTQIASFCNEWKGTVQWTAQSPFRKLHKRKNWFIGVVIHDAPKHTKCDAKDFTYQTLKASGPGGQNVNKVESVVRVIHLPSGISVTASDERSQMMNKKIATERIKNKLLSLQLEETNKNIQGQWMEHNTITRGNPVKVFKELLHH